MKKTMLLIGAVGAMMLVGGCAKGHQGSANMGAVSGSTCSEKKACCSEKKECCNKDKAAMGAVSGTCSEKKECTSKDKAAMGAVSGSSCSEKKDCASKCSSAK